MQKHWEGHRQNVLPHISAFKWARSLLLGEGENQGGGEESESPTGGFWRHNSPFWIDNNFRINDPINKIPYTDSFYKGNGFVELEK